MKNGILSVAILATITIILAGSLLVPTINDATDGDPITYRNDTGVYVEKSAADGALSITKAADSEDIVVGENTTTRNSLNRTMLAVTGCTFVLTKNTQTYYLLINDTANNKYLMVDSTSSLEVNVSDGVCTYTVDSDTYSVNVASDYFYYDPDGTYAACTPTSGVYTKLSDYVAYTQVSRHTYWYTPTEIYDNATADDTLTASITSEKVPGSEDKMDYITGTTINDVTSYVAFAPRVTTIHINEMDGTLSTMLYAVPVLVIVSILLGVVGIAIRNRD